jgi:hypothetical protein
VVEEGGEGGREGGTVKEEAHQAVRGARREQKEQTCKKTFLSEFIQKPTLLPGAPSKLLEGGVRKKSCAQSDMNLKLFQLMIMLTRRGIQLFAM